MEWYTQLVAEEVKQDPFAYQELPSAESHGSLALGARRLPRNVTLEDVEAQKARPVLTGCGPQGGHMAL